MAATLAIALRERLKAAPTLAALSDVYWDHPGAHPVYPYLVVRPIEAAPEYNTSDSRIDTLSLQLTIDARTNAEAQALGEAAWEALRPTAANPPLAFDDGQEVVRLPGVRRGPDERAGQGPAGRDIWQFSFDCKIIVGRG